MECDWVQRVVHNDGSATETQQCQLTDPFVVFPGIAPETAFINIGPPCIWQSDYFLTTTGEVVLAETGRLIVTPSGQVHVKTHYPAEPLDC